MVTVFSPGVSFSLKVFMIRVKFKPAFSHGDEFNISSRFALPSDESIQVKLQSVPCHYTILWRRLVVKLSPEVEFPGSSPIDLMMMEKRENSR